MRPLRSRRQNKAVCLKVKQAQIRLEFANLRRLFFPAPGHTPAEAATRYRLVLQNWSLVVASISLDGTTNGLRPLGYPGVRQLSGGMSDYCRTKCFPCHVAVKL
jgi:hypothetical protein